MYEKMEIVNEIYVHYMIFIVAGFKIALCFYAQMYWILHVKGIDYCTVEQCCQLADNLAAKYKSGPIKISAAGKIRGRIFCRFV
jgi:hypothetical protein